MLDERDGDSQTGESLSELASDRTAAQNRQALRLLGELVEEVLVGEKGDARQTIDRRNGGTAAGRDHEILCAEASTADLDFVRRSESRLAVEYVDAERFEPLRGVVRRDLGPPLAHARPNPGDVEPGFLRLETPGPRVTDVGRQPSRREDRFGRHAAGVQALAAHPCPLDERDAAAQAGRARRGHEPGRAAADHDDVVGALSLWLFH